MQGIHELARRTGIPEDIWEALMNPAAQLPREEDLPALGTPITLGEASRRYNLPLQTISRWTKRGFIRTIQEPSGPGLPKLVDEHDVAEIVGKYRMYDGSQGKRTAVLNPPSHVGAAAGG